MKRILLILFLLGISILGTGCIQFNNTDYRMKPVELSSIGDERGGQENLYERVMSVSRPASFKDGDRVRILTLDGARRIYRITSVNENSFSTRTTGLFSEEYVINFGDIVFMEKDFGKGRNYWSIFPLLEPLDPDDAAMDCPEVLNEILRTNILRGAISTEIFQLEWTIVEATFSLALHDIPREQVEHDRTALLASQDRMVQLLRLFEGKECAEASPASRLNQSPYRSMNPDKVPTVIAGVASLKEAYAAGTIEQREHLKAVNKELDTLFVD